MKYTVSQTALVLAALIILNGCMKMGPDYKQPDTGIETPESYQNAPFGPVTTIPEDRWWEVFIDPELNGLVDEVMENNLDIRKTVAQVLEIQARFVQTRADRFPEASLQFQAQRQRQPINIPIPGSPAGYTINSYTLSLPASFELDLWGRLARAEEAALADLLTMEETRNTIAQTVVAETITLYLQIESLERRIQITEQNIASFRDSVALVERRYRRGLTSILDLKQASRILAQAEAVLPALRQELGTAQQRLAVLLGRYPETRPPRPQPEDYFRHLEPVPPGLPSDLLLRRPDIRAAEARLMAANARVGVAKASRFPRISLTGSFGYNSTELDGLFSASSELWNVALGIVQPLFNAGRLEAGQRAAEARYQQEAVEYAITILNGFAEVERALLTRKEQLERRERLLNLLREARSTMEVAESRYKRGLVDYLTVLDAQRTNFIAQDDLVLADLAILSNRVALYRALGGGWAEPAPVEPQKTHYFLWF